MSDPLKIGIIGCGKVAQGRHLPALAGLAGAQVTALADSAEEALDQAAAGLGLARKYRDYRKLLEDREVGAVGICTPLATHFEIASAALAAGKHVLLEKPLAMNMDEAEALVALAAGSHLKVQFGLNHRWHPVVRRMTDILRQGRYGPVEMVNAAYATGHYGRYLPDWRLRRAEGGGVLIELGTHYYDLWELLSGSRVEEVMAMTGLNPEADDDPALVSGRMASGVMVSLAASDMLPDMARLDVFCRKAVLTLTLGRFDGLEIVPLYSSAGSVGVRLRQMAYSMRQLAGRLSQGRRGRHNEGTYRRQWESFIAAIRQDLPVECTLEDGRRALAVALAVVHSAATGARVKVAEAPRTFTPKTMGRPAEG
jgi:predicted dehydrogenase